MRLASKEDLDRAARLRARAEEALHFVRARFREEGVRAKVLGCDFTLDGRHLVIHYSAEERVNLRRFAPELARALGARIEFVAEGPGRRPSTLGPWGPAAWSPAAPPGSRASPRCPSSSPGTSSFP